MCYVHSVPGRIRVKVPGLKKLSSDVNKSLNDIKGIDSIFLNKTTGSVVVKYDQYLCHPFDILKAMKINPVLDVNTLKRRNNGKKPVCTWLVGELFQIFALYLVTIII